ncbi:uncharacterized protein J3D65DRAFT_465477 [Phyllosticta citribraziliensis]|uniref:Uncharacterized protein n=1 Tax=Phyllosticta citribraziliensis TaxID=989973 RepID=A0ABR1LHM0_9PEZI
MLRPWMQLSALVQLRAARQTRPLAARQQWGLFSFFFDGIASHSWTAWHSGAAEQSRRVAGLQQDGGTCTALHCGVLSWVGCLGVVAPCALLARLWRLLAPFQALCRCPGPPSPPPSCLLLINNSASCLHHTGHRIVQAFVFHPAHIVSLALRPSPALIPGPDPGSTRTRATPHSFSSTTFVWNPVVCSLPYTSTFAVLACASFPSQI